MLNAGTQSRSSTYCMAAVCGLKPVNSGIVTINVAIATIRLKVRASGARASLPVASTAMPPRIGSQIARLRRFWVSMRAGGPRLAMQEEGHEQEQPDDHGKGVVIDVAGLHVAHDARQPADRTRRAVHRQSVDDFYITDAPQQAAQATGATGEYLLVEFVEAILAHQQVVERLYVVANPVRQMRLAQVQQPGQTE